MNTRAMAASTVLTLATTGCMSAAQASIRPDTASVSRPPTAVVSQPDPAPGGSEAARRFVRWDLRVVYPDTEMRHFVVAGAAEVPLRSGRWRCRHGEITHPAEFPDLEVVLLVCVDRGGATFDIRASCLTSDTDHFASVPVTLHEGGPGEPGETNTVILFCKNF